MVHEAQAHQVFNFIVCMATINVMDEHSGNLFALLYAFLAQ